MLFLSKFPTEISDRILEYLPRSSKLQCLAVCKSWYRLTLPKLNRFIELYGSRDVTILSRFFDNKRINGNDIRVLYLSASFYLTDKSILGEIILHILGKCTNLQVLYLGHYSNQIMEWINQNKRALPLGSLKAIYAPFNLNLQMQHRDKSICHQREYIAIQPYCHKIVQVSLNVCDYRNNYGQDPKVFRTTLNSLVHLQKLSIEFNSDLVFDDIISACPNLKTLQLIYSGHDLLNSKLETYLPKDHAHTTKKSQLKTLVIRAELLSYELLEYLTENCNHLYQLTLRGYKLHTPNVLKTAKQPPIRHLQFVNNFDIAIDLIEGFANFFSRSLKRLDLVNCGLINATFQPNNTVLNLTSLDLEFFLIDTGPVQRLSSSLNKTALEITFKNGETKYFEHEWKPGNLFTREDSRKYTCRRTRQKRIYSNRTWVLTIATDSIKFICLYNDLYQDPVYRQSIDLSS